MRKALFDINKFAIRDRYGRCESQKDGREERKEEKSDARHGRQEDSECGGFTRGIDDVG